LSLLHYYEVSNNICLLLLNSTGKCFLHPPSRLGYVQVRQKNEWISSNRYAATGGGVEWAGRPLGRRENAVSVGNMEWSGAQRAFVVEKFLKNSDNIDSP
jgi:hypothetical protein